VERVYPDTNVLFPMTLMDLLLSMAEDYHHDIVWSDFLLEEWERVIVSEKRRTPEEARAISAAIRHAFPAGRVAAERYDPILDMIPGPDDDDRVHAAAAIAGEATALLTENIRHFDTEFMAARGVTVERVEPYLLARLEAAPEAMVATIERILALKRNPVWTLEDYLDRLRRAGATIFADRLAAGFNTPTNGPPTSN